MRIVTLAVLTIIASSTSAFAGNAAYDSPGDFQRLCRNIVNSDDLNLLGQCSGIVMGALYGAYTAASIAGATNIQDALECYSSTSPKQLADIAISYIDKNPEAKNWALGEALLTAWGTAGCPK